MILDGRLALETRLPGERELATALNVSRTTIASALGLLREEGYLQSRQGSGSRIALPAGPLLPGEQTLSAPSVNLATAALSAGPEVHQAYQPRADADAAVFRHYTGYDQQGLVDVARKRLPAAIANAACRRRRDEVMIVNGALSGFALVLRLLTGPGDRVVVDAPSYPMAINAIRGASCRPIGVSFTGKGLGLRRPGGDHCPNFAAAGLYDAGFS